jgi:hypothetical protein
MGKNISTTFGEFFSNLSNISESFEQSLNKNIVNLRKKFEEGEFENMDEEKFEETLQRVVNLVRSVNKNLKS